MRESDDQRNRSVFNNLQHHVINLLRVVNKIISMSLVNSYVNHTLNKSKAKAAFSFPKSIRLKQENKGINHSFYQLPDMRSKRACSLGYGSKTDLAQKSMSPSPVAYQVKSTFNQNHHSLISFGKSRDMIKFGSFLDIIDQERKKPAPNSYKTKLRGIIAKRLPTQLDNINKQRVPGPGAYEPKHLNMSDAGQYFISKFKNQSSPRYHNPETEAKPRLATIGPGAYQLRNQFGKSILSQFRNSIIGSFPKSQRQGIIDKAKLKVPGFKYRSFSQFGEPAH